MGETATEAYKKIQLDMAIEEIVKSSMESSIYIGCDSQVTKRARKNKPGTARYSVVIIIHKDSKHGCRVFHYDTILPDYGNLKMRLMQEVMFAGEAACAVVDYIGSRHMEIHLDLNPSPRHKSSIAVKEALGYIAGMGFTAKVKPDAFAATHGSDHAVRGKICHHVN